MDTEYESENGIITQPGKFEGQPVFAPKYWDIALQGFADSDDGKTFSFKIDRLEKQKDPVLAKWLGKRHILRLSEDSQGFVSCF